MFNTIMAIADRNVAEEPKLVNGSMKNSGPKKPPRSMKVLYIPIALVLDSEGTTSYSKTIREVNTMPPPKPSKNPINSSSSEEGRRVYE